MRRDTIPSTNSFLPSIRTHKAITECNGVKLSLLGRTSITDIIRIPCPLEATPMSRQAVRLLTMAHISHLQRSHPLQLIRLLPVSLICILGRCLLGTTLILVDTAVANTHRFPAAVLITERSPAIPARPVLVPCTAMVTGRPTRALHTPRMMLALSTHSKICLSTNNLTA